jgi:nucleotide-binding universal stress UspA family protein
MALKDLMVHLNTGERAAVRLAFAADIARAKDARLVGVFGQRALPEQVGVIATWPSPDYVEAAAASKAAFVKATAGLRDAEWRDINRGSDSELLRLITEAARYADLVVVGQHDESVPTLTPPDLAEELVIHSGRPVLVIPYAGEYTHAGRRPLIAWDHSRESAHALNDALPLIQGCAEAIVVSLDTPYEEAEKSCAEVARHLACHGIKARTEVLLAEDEHVMDFVLNRVTDLDADLLVIGAHRHTSFPRAAPSANSRAILRAMVVPTLVAR